MRLARYHGLGNDYLVLIEGGPLRPGLVRALCDRHTGVGGDGILEPFATDRADFGVTIWNPDGSTAEKSGNGLRIYARWLVDAGRAGPRFSVWTGACRVVCAIDDEAVTVGMGAASFAPADVPVIADGPVLDAPIALDGEEVRACAVGIGNPHCVIFVDVDPDAVPWRRWGEQLERHPRFPNRTNVQIARVAGPDVVDVRIWERGAGPTLASGSSACAVVAAAVRTGRLAPGQVTVRMPGGAVGVGIDERLEITLRGPVERVAEIEVDGAWLHRRTGDDT